eukprot:scaffold1667_cov258-Pinguiococcus_pyrenoidosus.AAC.5
MMLPGETGETKGDPDKRELAEEEGEGEEEEGNSVAPDILPARALGIALDQMDQPQGGSGTRRFHVPPKERHRDASPKDLCQSPTCTWISPSMTRGRVVASGSSPTKIWRRGPTLASTRACSSRAGRCPRVPEMSRVALGCSPIPWAGRVNPYSCHYPSYQGDLQVSALSCGNHVRASLPKTGRRTKTRALECN